MRRTPLLQTAPHFARRTVLPRLLCLALLASEALVPPTARADDSYSALWQQLDQLVVQRASLLKTLAEADGTVGGLLTRDLVGSLRPLLDAQSRLIGDALEQAQRDPFAPLPATPALDRSAGPGVLLGAHQPLAQPAPRIPARTPRRVQQASLRQGLLSASALSLSQAAPGAAVPGAPTSATAFGALALSPAAGTTLADLGAALAPATLAALSAAQAPAASPRYATLGGAQDLAPTHSIAVDGRVLRLSDVAPQAISPAPPARQVAVPVSPPPPAHGLTALHGYDLAASTMRATVDGLTIPPALSSTGLDPSQRVTNVAAVQGQLGHYALAAPSNTAATVPATAIAPTIAPQVTWAFSATTPLASGGTLFIAGGGHANGSSMHDLQLAAFNRLAGSTAPGTLLPVVSPAATPGTRISLQLTDNGSGMLSLVTTLADTTTISAVARIEGLDQDSALQTALSHEQLALTELGSVISAGNALYARLQPLYVVQEQQYSLAASAVIAHNNALDQAWWDRTTAYHNYQVALSSWLARKAAYDHWLARRQEALQPQAGAARRITGRATEVVQGSGASSSYAAAATPVATDTPVATASPVPAATSAQHAPGSGIFGAQMGNTGQVRAAGATNLSASLADQTLGDSLQVEQASAIILAQPALTPVFGPPPATDTPTTEPAIVTPAASATPIPTGSPSLFDAATTPAAITATASPVVPSATDTETPPQSTATDTAATSTATAASSGMLPTLTGTATPTLVPSSSPTVVLSATGTPSPMLSPTGVATAEPTETTMVATATPANAAPTPAPDAPTATVTADAVQPPGPPPAPVAPPGPEPVLAPLPPPVLPLPGWVVAPPAYRPPTININSLPPLNATGIANISREQLIADGALDGVGSYMPPLQGVITTLWGGSTPWQSFHTGIDIATARDTPVRAAADGIVVYAGLAVPGAPTMSYGNCVMIQHNDHIVTLYGHMDMGAYGLQVQVGEQVHQGQVIGYEGETGWATGPHVHFEMRIDNMQFNPLLLISVQQIAG